MTMKIIIIIEIIRLFALLVYLKPYNYKNYVYT